jgi:hypothetical protein
MSERDDRLEAYAEALVLGGDDPFDWYPDWSPLA